MSDHESTVNTIQGDDRETFRPWDLSPEDIRRIASMEPPLTSAWFDHELET